MRMTSWNLETAMRRLNEHFHFLRSDGDNLPTIDWILERAKVLVRRFGMRGLIIDPYNEIEHRRPDNMTETEYVSLMLARVRRFAIAHGVHVWFVAHPAKMRPENGKTPAPTLYEISGSANFVNKTDCGLTVHRGDVANTTDVYVRKVRQKWIGQQGKATLGYNPATGAYSDLGEWKTA
jgi:twinkle protein